MSETLVCRLLDRATIDRAFPLIRGIVPGITLDHWAHFVRKLLSTASARPRRGLMTVQNPSGYILGFFSFEVRDDLYETRSLLIDNIIVADIPGRDSIWGKVMRTAEQLADMNNCRAIRANLSNDLDLAQGERTWTSASLAKAGYALNGISACKRLAGAMA
jgi:hypothetical protein